MSTSQAHPTRNLDAEEPSQKKQKVSNPDPNTPNGKKEPTETDAEPALTTHEGDESNEPEEIEIEAIVHHEQPDGLAGDAETLKFKGVHGSFEEMLESILKPAVYGILRMKEDIKEVTQGGELHTEGSREWSNSVMKVEMIYKNVSQSLMHSLHTFMHDALHKLSYNLQAVKSCTAERPDLYCMTGSFDFNRTGLIKLPVISRGDKKVTNICAWFMRVKDLED